MIGPLPFLWATLVISVGLVVATYFDAMDDTILHKINWAGPLPEDLLVKLYNGF
jgi:hypothetical protein